VTRARTVVFDNEAVQAMLDHRHRKHRRALVAVETVVSRKLRRDGLRLVVPTSVRVEAGWDRTTPKAAAVNQLRIVDVALDDATADQAAHLCSTLGVSVAAAHLGAVVATTPGPHAVLTSDAEEVRRLAEHLAADVRIAVL
jgi:hypothetical protein